MKSLISESDWKYLRSIHDEMLHALCSRINNKAVDIVMREGKNPHEQYLELYRHIKESDRVVADCFNDWRRSNIDIKIALLRRHRLLQDSHLAGLSDGARKWVAGLDEIG